MHKLKNFIICFYKAILIGILIIILSIISANTVNKINFIHIKNADKIVHFLMYFGFTLFLTGGFKKYYLINNLSLFNRLIIIISGILFGACMEIIQLTFTKTRSAEFYDFFANTLGSIMAILFYSFLVKNKFIKKILE